MADVFGAQGLRWKRLRALSAPAFTTNKLKAMEGKVKESVIAFVEMIAKKADMGKPFDIKPWVLI
jgi:cytochrome P450 family 13